MLSDLGDQLIFRTGFALPTAGVVGIPSPKLVTHGSFCLLFSQ